MIRPNDEHFRSLRSLHVIDIPVPCHVPWDDMKGDATARHCDSCRKHVFDISTLSEREALDLIRNHDGDLCVRLLRRPDGTVMIADCAKPRQRIKRIKAGKKHQEDLLKKQKDDELKKAGASPSPED